MIIHSSEPFALFDGHARSFLLHHRLLTENPDNLPFDEWGIGLSGGGDSVFLLHLLLRHKPSRIRLRLLHFDHHTNARRNESDRNFVSDMATSLGLPITLEESNSPEKDRPDISETKLRKERHAFFDRYLLQHPKSALFLGHQADDRIETILANIFRGGGPRSLIGITQSTNGRIFRPLLTIRREKIRETLFLAGIPYNDDPTNKDIAHQRNRIRHRIRPMIDRFFPPHGTEHIDRLATLMEAEVQSDLPSRLGLLCEEISCGHIRFSLFLYRSMRPSAQGLFVRALMNRQKGYSLPVPPERNILRTLEDLTPSTEKSHFPLGQDWSVNVVLGRVDLVYQYFENWSFGIVELPKEGLSLSVSLPRGGLVTVKRLPSGFPETEPSGIRAGMSCILRIPDPSSENAPEPEQETRITYWAPELRILPGAGDPSPRPLSSLWKSRKIPEIRRRTWPVVCRNGFALWMPGLLDRTFLLDPEPKGAACLLTYQERERSEWKKFLENP